MEDKANLIKSFKESKDVHFFKQLADTRSSQKDMKSLKLSEIYKDIYSKDINSTLKYLQKSNGLMKNEENQHFFKTMSRK